uniref:ThuA domain-containing protein n=1 Tax=Algoriphagus sp. TaxID=1872435 RepID=UPI004048A8F2
MSTLLIKTMKKNFFLNACLMLVAFATFGQNLPVIPVNSAWIQKIESLAPQQTRFPSSGTKKVLLFSLHTGFEHWVIPHTDEVIKVLGTKSKQFEVVASKDIHQFEKESLGQYDAIVLNNTCSKPDHRNLFWDQLRLESAADSAEIMLKAQELETNLSEFVQQGGGLLVLHGAVTLLNNSSQFSSLLGASFDYHPKQQEIQVELVNPNHPLVAAFSGNSFNHVDEPYFYKSAYSELDFTPLLYFDNAKIQGQRKNQELTEGRTYVSWIRPEGKGKVMYISPSHNAQSFENPALLQFMLDGLQYVVGEVNCDETPLLNR